MSNQKTLQIPGKIDLIKTDIKWKNYGSFVSDSIAKKRRNSFIKKALLSTLIFLIIILAYFFLFQGKLPIVGYVVSNNSAIPAVIFPEEPTALINDSLPAEPGLVIEPGTIVPSENPETVLPKKEISDMPIADLNPSISDVSCINCTDCNSKMNNNTAFVLSQDVVYSDTCIIINADNVTFDCQGHSIYINATASSKHAVQLSGARFNVTVRNCNINGTGYTGGRGINLVTSGRELVLENLNITNMNYSGMYLNVISNSKIRNSIISRPVYYSGTNYGIYILGTSNNTVFENNSISGYGNGFWSTSAFAKSINLTGNDFLNNGSSSVDIYLTAPQNFTLWANNIYGKGIIATNTQNSSFCVNGIGNYFNSLSGLNTTNQTVVNGSCGTLKSAWPFPSVSKFDGLTSNFSLIDSAIINLTLENTTYGRIDWLNTFNADHANFDSYVLIGNNSIIVNSSYLLQSINSSANITLYNLKFVSPGILVDPELDGTYVVCSAPNCNILSYSSGNFTFNTTHFSGFKAYETASFANSESTNLSEWKMFRRNLNHTGYYPDSVNMTNFGISWTYTIGTIYYSSPAIANGIVYMGSFDNSLHAINTTTGNKIWSYATGDDIYHSAAVADDVVYIGSIDKKVYAINATNGTKIWNYSVAVDGQPSSPAVSNGIVYIATFSSTTDTFLYALSVINGTQIWNFSFYRGTASSPAIVNGLVYIGSLSGTFYALNATNGTQIWNNSLASNGNNFVSPAVSNGIVYVGSSNRYMYALNATNGTKIWEYFVSDPNGGMAYSSPAIANGVVYFGTRDKRVYALNATNGTQIWNYTTGGAIDSSPAVTNGTVYIGSDDYSIYALNATNGTKLWSYGTGDTVRSSPAIADGVVYIGATNKKVYAFKANTLPTASLISPANGTTTSQVTQTFICNATDETALTNITVYIWNSTKSLNYTNTTAVSGTFNQTNWTYTFPYGGNFSWNCLTYDLAGNYDLNDANWTLEFVDTIAPNVSLISPVNAASVSNATQTFSCNASDNSALANITLYIWNSTKSLNYTNTTAVSGTFNQTNWTYTLPYKGNFSWNCLTYDRAGNYGWNDVNWTLVILNNFPTQNNPILNSTFGTNFTFENLACSPQSLSDADNDAVYPVFNWMKNDVPLTVLNMPFDIDISSNETGAIKDYSGLNNNGTLGGDPVWTVGKIGGAYQFDGVDDYLLINKSLGFYNFSISLWFKNNQASQTEKYLVSNTYWMIRLNGGVIEFYPTSSGADWQSSGITSPIGEWHHLAVTYEDKANDEIKFYWDGVLNKTNFQGGTTRNGSIIVTIGARNDGNIPSIYGTINGTIDEFDYYGDKILTSAQISQLYLEGNNSLNTSTIVSGELTAGDNWTCQVTPNDLLDDGTTLNSNNLTVKILPVVNLNCTIEASQTCSEGIPILRMQNESGGYDNAHAQAVNASEYGVSNYSNTLCCHSNFTLTNQNGTVFLRLSNFTNAHVQDPDVGGYDYADYLGVIGIIGVGYDVSCNVVAGSCSAGQECLISMASSEGNNFTNAHVASCGHYSTNVCCGITSDNWPNVVMISPSDSYTTKIRDNIFNCTATDDINLNSLTLNVWNPTALYFSDTKSISGLENQSLWSINSMPDNTYTWNCKVTDSFPQSVIGSNRTMQIDGTSPTVSFVSPTEIHGSTIYRNNVQVNVTASDPHLSGITIYLYNSTHSPVTSQSSAASPNFADFAGLSAGTYYFNATATDSFGNSQDTETRTVNLVFYPKITFVSSIANVDPEENNYKNVEFSFTAYDDGGTINLNSSTANAKFTRSGVTRNASCSYLGDIDSNNANYSCTIAMNYFDSPGSWKINVSIKNNNDYSAANDTTSFTYNELLSFILTPSSINWPTLNRGDFYQIPLANNFSVLKNTGNVDVPTGGIKIKASDVFGLDNPSYTIGAGNFTASKEAGASACFGDQLQNGTNVTITGLNLPKASETAESTVNIYYCVIEIPDVLIKQQYSNLGNPWVISISLSLALIVPARRKRKSKLLNALDNELRKEYDISLDELSSFIKTKRELKERSMIPISLFKDSNPLEALVRHMKENLTLKFSKIAELLNRDERTIWITYRNALKRKGNIIIEGKSFIPISIFANRRLSILENLVTYLHKMDIANAEIARMTGKDPRNISTFYNRAVKKIAARK